MFRYLSVMVDTYTTYKEKLDAAMLSTADSMVRVGYLLMQARDTDILRESGYSGIGEFAQKEYGLSPDQTSRFIGIAERFGDGEGRLKDEWQQYGYTKLSEMLTLPEEVAKAIPPEITRDEIREIKSEIKAEQEITPIEVAIEKSEEEAKNPERKNWTQLNKFFLAYFRPAEMAGEFVRVIMTDWDKKWGEEENRRVVLDALAPSGIGFLAARIPGEGRFMLSFKGENTLPCFINTREETTQEVSWEEVRNGFSELTEGLNENIEDDDEKAIRGMWSELYGEEYPDIQENDTDTGKKQEKKVKIAPAQKPGSRISTPQDRNAKKEKPENKPVAEDKKPESRIFTPQDGDAKNENAETTGVTEAENPESRISTPQDGDGEKKGDILPTPIREPKIKDQVKRINRLALDLGDYAHRLEKLTANNNYDNVSTLFFNLNEFYTKLQGEGEYLIELLKMRWDDEDYFDEEQEAEDE